MTGKLRLSIAGGVVLAVAAAGAAYHFANQRLGRAPHLDLSEINGVRYVDDAACAACHQAEFKAWTNSNHDWAMRPATAPNVLADFNNTSFTHFGVETKFSKRGEKFYVTTEGDDGQPHEYEIKYTFGFDPLQQYLIEFPGGRIQCLTVAWDTKQKRWFHLYPDERIQPNDPLHWTGRYQNWNVMCAECHSTNVRKNYNAETGVYRTEWSALTIGCQACHGPGGRHIEWGERFGKGFKFPEGQRPAAAEMFLATDYRMGGAKLEVQSCAPCHSRRHFVANEQTIAADFMDKYSASLMDPNLYFADGQQRDEVYVYGSFLQSRMHQRGVRCTDCHDPHTAKLKRPGNETCTECHQLNPPERFAIPQEMRKVFDTPAHHFHKPGAPGSRCVDCHMPSRTYMVVDPRQDHSFRVPRPDLSAKTGSPDACTICHKDKNSAWAAAAVAKWYGSLDEHGPLYGEAFARAWNGDTSAAPLLLEIARDDKQAGYARASALNALREMPPQPFATHLLKDPDPMVRAGAASLAVQLAPAERAENVGPLLRDPVRAVRIEAARALILGGAASTSGVDPAALKAARAEFEAAQMAAGDMPGAWLNLAVVANAEGDSKTAERYYRRALQMDATFVPAALNLASMLNGQQRNEEAEQVLRAAASASPSNGEVRYSLGLLLAERNKFSDATAELGKAAELLPRRARVRYNYALVLQQSGRGPESEAQLLIAHEMEARDPDVLNALVQYYGQNRRYAQALLYAERLASLLPRDPRLAQLVERLRIEAQRAR